METPVDRAASIGPLALVATLAAACDRPPPAGHGQEPAGEARATGSPPHAAGMKPMRKIEVLVGGCRDDCGEPRLAAARFIDATARDPAAAVPFLDTTSLMLDGVALGARWADQWKETRAATRKDEIARTAADLAGWTTGLGAEQVKAALTAGPRPLKVWTTEARFEFDPPGAAAPWRIVLRPRGLEWLVVEVVRSAGGSPARD